MRDPGFQTRIETLRERVARLPVEDRAPLLRLLEETRARHRCIRDVAEAAGRPPEGLDRSRRRMLAGLDAIEDALCELRLQTRMILFDLEARRRQAEDGVAD